MSQNHPFEDPSDCMDVLPSADHNLKKIPDPPFNEQYLRALENRDSAIEAHLVAYFRKSIRIQLRNRLRSPECVQDASQETFLRVFTHFRLGKSLQNPTSLPAFVHGVCRNVAMEMLRSSSRHHQLSKNTAEYANPNDDPEDHMVTVERKRIVKEILNKLAPKDQELLRRLLLGEENEENRKAVCREFQVDRGYLRVLLYRARLQFKTALELGLLKRNRIS
jgi:RNA polymerase sigma-70 factor, ECF subfamily